jgi:Outer membrane protein beta-barrel domain
MKILFSAIVLLASFSLKSQIQFGGFAGPQITDARIVIKDKRQESSIKIGGTAGLQLKVPFEGRLSFAPFIAYNLRGYNVKFSSPAFPPDPTATDNDTRFHTVEVGFLFQHDFNLEPGHVFIRFGPSLDFALIGNEKFNTPNGMVDRKMKFSFGDYGHYLASAILQIGFETKNGIYFYGHYNYSLTTMNNADNGASIGNRAAGISIGKYFKRKN